MTRALLLGGTGVLQHVRERERRILGGLGWTHGEIRHRFSTDEVIVSQHAR